MGPRRVAVPSSGRGPSGAAAGAHGAAAKSTGGSRACEPNRSVPAAAVAGVGCERGRPASGSANLLTTGSRRPGKISGGVDMSPARKSFHSFRGQGSGLDPRGARLELERRRSCPPPWAFSSGGKSARLITVRSVVRVHKGPPGAPPELWVLAGSRAPPPERRRDRPAAGWPAARLGAGM